MPRFRACGSDWGWFEASRWSLDRSKLTVLAHKIFTLEAALFNRINTHTAAIQNKSKTKKENSTSSGPTEKSPVLYGNIPKKPPHGITRVPTERRETPMAVNNTASEATARILDPYGMEVAHKPTLTLRGQLMKPRTIPEAVVYKGNCKNCPAKN